MRDATPVNGENETTFVSCLYDLSAREVGGRERTIEQYLELSRAVIAARVPLVLFIDRHLESALGKLVAEVGDPRCTSLVVAPLEESVYFRHLPTITAHFAAGRRSATCGNLLKDTPAYVVLSWTKQHLLQMAMDLDLHVTPRFAWIDIGVAHAAPLPVSGLGCLASRASDRIRLCALVSIIEADVRDRDRYYRERVIPAVASGFFGGRRDQMQELGGRFAEEVTRCLDTGWPSFDETIFGAMVVDDPDRFELYRGSHLDLFTNFDLAVPAAVALRANDRIAATRALADPDARTAGARELLLWHQLPHDVEREARGIELENAPVLADWINETRVGTVTVPTESGWSNSNPTIASDDEGYRAVVRQVNYELRNGGYHFPGGEAIVRTRNVLVHLTPDLTVDWSIEMTDHESPLRAGHGVTRGFEDLRLFRHDGRWRALAVVAEAAELAIPQVALLTLDDAGFVSDSVLLAGPAARRPEKNWVPVIDEHAGPMVVVYSWWPLIVGEIDESTGALRVVHRSETPLIARHFRGGAQVIAAGGQLLTVIHETLAWPDGDRWYQHRFVGLSRDLQIMGISRPFRFVGASVEFCCGMATRGDELVVTFGVQDHAAALAVLPLEQAFASLNDCTVGLDSTGSL